MKRPGILRRVAGLLVGASLLLSLVTPARAQFDPLTLSLIMGGLQLIGGVATAIGLGIHQDGKQQGIAMPYGTPCGMVDGVPQICWQPHGGGFEGSPDLPTGAKSYSAPAPPSHSVELQLEIQPLESATKDAKGPTPGQ